jgi:hypothetical protein
MFAANVVRCMRLLAPMLGVVLLAVAAPFASAATGGAEAAAPATASSPDASSSSDDNANATSLPGPGAVQRALGVTVTYRWDHATRAAVRVFQRRHHLTADGVVGPKTAAALGLSSTATDASHSTHTSAELQKIAQCESGGDPTAVSPDGRYRGKYQFTPATWKLVGGKGDPAKARESEQDSRAAKLLASDGVAAWPVCG